MEKKSEGWFLEVRTRGEGLDPWLEGVITPSKKDEHAYYAVFQSLPTQDAAKAIVKGLLADGPSPAQAMILAHYVSDNRDRELKMQLRASLAELAPQMDARELFQLAKWSDWHDPLRRKDGRAHGYLILAIGRQLWTQPRNDHMDDMVKWGKQRDMKFFVDTSFPNVLLNISHDERDLFGIRPVEDLLGKKLKRAIGEPCPVFFSADRIESWNVYRKGDTSSPDALSFGTVAINGDNSWQHQWRSTAAEKTHIADREVGDTNYRATIVISADGTHYTFRLEHADK
jgi:hypothetical protein